MKFKCIILTSEANTVQCSTSIDCVFTEYLITENRNRIHVSRISIEPVYEQKDDMNDHEGVSLLVPCELICQCGYPC